MDDGSRLIELTQGQLARVDAEDYEWLSKWDWSYHRHAASRIGYAYRVEDNGDCYASGRKKKSRILMHRQIMGLEKGREPIVDHKNGDGIDNRRNNLRAATCAQNAYNRQKKKGKYIYIGVSRHRSGTWSANLEKGGVSLFLGNWPTEIMAAVARDSAARYYHGEFARLNLPGIECNPKSADRLVEEAHIIRKNTRSSSSFRWVSRQGVYYWRVCITTINGICERVHCGRVWRSEIDAGMAADSALNYLGDVSGKRNFPDIIVRAFSPEELTRMARGGGTIKWQ